MPAELPLAAPTARELSARDDGDGFDTQVARFFGATAAKEDDADTLVESAQLGQSARSRVRDRNRNVPRGLKT